MPVANQGRSKSDLVALVGGLALVLVSAAGLLVDPDRAVPLILVRLAVAVAVAGLAWLVIPPRRPQVFRMAFGIAALVLAVVIPVTG